MPPSISFRIVDNGVGRLPAATERAIYFAASEAIQNATKHSGAGAVVMTLEPLGDIVEVTIADDGGGFDDDLVPPGAGLTGIRDRIGSIGGDVEVTSAPGRRDRPALPGTGGRRDRGGDVTIKVVLGEDNYLVREGIERILSTDPELELVASCGDFDELRDAVERLEPDVVLTDIRMPPGETDEGIRLASELRASRPGLGVVVLSQHASSVYAGRALRRRRRRPRLRPQGPDRRRRGARADPARCRERRHPPRPGRPRRRLRRLGATRRPIA